MPKKITSFVIVLVVYSLQFCYSQVVGPYTGITYLTSLTGPCAPATLATLGDNNFTTNGGVEIPIGTTFSGTWASGIGYTDDPSGPDMLCVSLHTEEGWNVALRLSDGSTTASQYVYMNTILDYTTWDFIYCTGGWLYGFYYDRRIAFVDFSSYTIPAGLTVIGATFELATDNAANPDPVGIVLLRGLTDPPGPTGTADNNGPLCEGDSLVLNADFTDTTTYLWSGPGSFSSTQKNPVIYPVTLANAGTYTCILTDTAGGFADTVTTNVVINPKPTANIVLPVACEFQNYSYSFTGANDTITGVHWDFGTSASNDTSNLTSPQFNYPGDGSYTITLALVSNNGCMDTVNANIYVHPKPVANFTTDTICRGSSFTYDPAIISDTTVNYSWVFAPGTPSSSTDSAVTVAYTTAGVGNANLVLMSDYGCIDTFNFSILVMPDSDPDFGVYPICISRFTFDPLPAADDSAWVIDWNMGDGTVFNDVDTSAFNHNYHAAGTYNVQMIVTNQFGCVDSVTIPVEVKDSISIQMPNILYHSSSINNNKIDLETFKPGFNMCVNYTYTVYDRWGVKVFETVNDPLDPDLFCTHCFTGRTQNGENLSSGVYYFIMKGNFNVMDQGYITILD